MVFILILNHAPTFYRARWFCRKTFLPVFFNSLESRGKIAQGTNSNRNSHQEITEPEQVLAPRALNMDGWLHLTVLHGLWLLIHILIPVSNKGDEIVINIYMTPVCQNEKGKNPA